MVRITSGSSYRSSILILGEVVYKYRQWTSEIAEFCLSNWREMANLLKKVRDLCHRGLMNGVELFLFTDNVTAESCFTKGLLKSETLFELVLEINRV